MDALIEKLQNKPDATIKDLLPEVQDWINKFFGRDTSLKADWGLEPKSVHFPYHVFGD